MPKNIDKSPSKAPKTDAGKLRKAKKRGAILSAALILGYYGIGLVVILAAPIASGVWELSDLLPQGICFIVIGSVITGVLLALRQRLLEIDDGEEEAAKEY